MGQAGMLTENGLTVTFCKSSIVDFFAEKTRMCDVCNVFCMISAFPWEIFAI